MLLFELGPSVSKHEQMGRGVKHTCTAHSLSNVISNEMPPLVL